MLNQPKLVESSEPSAQRSWRGNLGEVFGLPKLLARLGQVIGCNVHNAVEKESLIGFH